MTPSTYALRHRVSKEYVQVHGSQFRLGPELPFAVLFTKINRRDTWHRLVHAQAQRLWPRQLEKVPVTDVAHTGIPTLA